MKIKTEYLLLEYGTCVFIKSKNERLIAWKRLNTHLPMLSITICGVDHGSTQNRLSWQTVI